MKTRTALAICLTIALSVLVVQAAELILPIPRAMVSIEVSGSPELGSSLTLSFQDYWVMHPQANGAEQFALWIALPDRGNPQFDAQGYTSLKAEFDLQNRVEIGKPSILRGVRIAPVYIKPTVQFNGKWEQMCRIDLQISSSGLGDNEVTSEHSSSAFRSLLHSFVINPPVANSDDFDIEHLLVICPDFAATNLAPFVEWKRRKGVECTLATLSEIGISPTDDQGLKDYLQQAYDTWTNPPDFVLLAGDETVLPTHGDYTNDPPTIFSTESVPGPYLDENYFACLEGNDFFPDLVLGRWVVNTAYEYVYLVAKITRYEMLPNLFQTDWYKKAQVGADHLEPSQRDTKLYTRQLMLNYGFSQVDTLFQPGQPNLFSQWINQGRSFINYRGSGWSMGWAGINFYIFDVFNLQNSFKLPVVTGIGCGVGRFEEPDGTCFGEAWMLVGSLSDQRGAISFIGPGHNTHTMYNDSLDIGIYQSMFAEGEQRIGAALVAGKMFLYDAFDDYISQDPNIAEILRVAFNQYYLLSDPELKPYTDIPARFQLEHPITVQVGSHPVTVTVRDSLGNPVSGAQVALYHPNDFMAVDETNSSGIVTLISNTLYLPGYVYLTVTKQNCAAGIDSILIISPSQYVVHRSVVLDDNAGGNGDGGFSPGETVNWTETLMNFGILTAPSVQAILTSTHPSVSINQAQSFYGNIPAGDSAIGNPDYQLHLTAAPYIIGDTLDFQIDIVDGVDSSWTSNLSFPLRTPDLQVISIVPDPEGNGLLDRGETCNIAWTIKNAGVTTVANGVFELHSSDPYIDIINGNIPCNPIPPNMQISSGSTPFVVSVSPFALTMHEIDFQVKLISPELTYQFADSDYFSLSVGQYGPDDPTPDSSGIYFGYESADNMYTEAPIFEWLEIDPENGGAGTVLPFTTQTQDLSIHLPFEFQYWGQRDDSLTISADGWINLGATNVISAQYYRLPHADGVLGMIAGLWCNLWNQTAETGRISYYYALDRGRFYIEWYQVSPFSGTTFKETFQIVLCDPTVEPTLTGDGEILYYYKDLDFFGVTFPTSGIESPDELFGANIYVHNDTTIHTSHGLGDSMAVRWTTDPPLISSTPPLPPGTSQQPVPTTLIFKSPYPNPCNASADLVFALPSSGQVKLDVFNVQGQLVVELFKGKLNSGFHHFTFNGSNLGSGLYFARLSVQDQTMTRKLLLLK